MLAQLITTLPDRASALELARDLVDSRLAACAQLLGPVTSVYRWEGRVHEEEEVLLLVKAPRDRMQRLVEAVRARHPYDTPELTTVTSDFVDDRYLAWASSETEGP